MKIVYVSVSLPYEGAAEAFFVPELTELRRLGHEVLLAPRQKWGQVMPTMAPLKEPVVPGGLLSPKVLWGSLLVSVSNPRVVAKACLTVLRAGTLLTRIKNALVIPRGIYIGTFARRFAADHIHVQWAGTTATVGLVAHEVSGVPWSFTAHRADIVVSNRFRDKARSAAFVRFISESGSVLSRRLHGETEGARCCVIHVGVILPVAHERTESHRANRTVLSAAHLVPVKGHRYLIQAMRLLKDQGVCCSLELAGDGPLQRRLSRLVADLELQDRVTFLGRVPHAGLLERYRRGDVDVFVLPSVDLGSGHHEGIPVALMEAMAHRIPVVATATGGIPELLKDGAGWMVPMMDPPSLASAISALLSNDKKRSEYADRGRQRVEREFDVARTTAALLHEMGESSEINRTPESRYSLNRSGRGIAPQ